MSWAKPFGNGMSLFLVWNRNEEFINDINEGPHRVWYEWRASQSACQIPNYHQTTEPIIFTAKSKWFLWNFHCFSWDSPINFCEGGAN